MFLLPSAKTRNNVNNHCRQPDVDDGPDVEGPPRRSELCVVHSRHIACSRGIGTYIREVRCNCWFKLKRNVHVELIFVFIILKWEFKTYREKNLNRRDRTYNSTHQLQPQKARWTPDLLHRRQQILLWQQVAHSCAFPLWSAAITLLTNREKYSF